MISKKIEEVLEEFNVTLNIEDSYRGGRSPLEVRFLQPSIRLRLDARTEVPNKSSCTFLIRKFQTGVRASTGAYFTAYVAYTGVYPAYIKARKL